jgi:hypothetical protein
MKLTSEIKEFPGTVERPDYLTLPQVIAFEADIKDVGKFEGSPAEADMRTLAIILPLYSDWQIKGQPDEPTPETFNFTPRRAGAKLVAWLLDGIMQVYLGEVEVPNE